MREDSTFVRAVVTIALVVALALLPACASQAETLCGFVVVETSHPQSLPATTTTDPALRLPVDLLRCVPVSSRRDVSVGHHLVADTTGVLSSDAAVAPKSVGPGNGLGPGAAHISDPAFSRPRIVIGQSMEARVKPWGRADNAKWYQAWRKNWHPNMTHDERLAGWMRNRRWLDRQMKRGAEIFDIGPDPTKAPSPFYRLERLYLRKHGYPVTVVPGVP